MALDRRPPNKMAEMGAPAGSLTAESSTGLLVIGAVKRLLGWAALVLRSGVQRWPVQSMHSAGGCSVLPSHHTSPSGKRATLVKIVSWAIVAMALGLVLALVPGTTPK